MKNLYFHALGGVKGVSNQEGYQYELKEWGYNQEKMDSVSMYRLKQILEMKQILSYDALENFGYDVPCLNGVSYNWNLIYLADTSMSEKDIYAYRESRKDNAFVHWACFTPSLLLDSSIEKLETFDCKDPCIYALHSSFRVPVEGQHTILESLSTNYIVGICIPLIAMSNYYNMSLDEYLSKREAQIEEIQMILDQNQLELPILETNTMTPIWDVNDYASEIQSIKGSIFPVHYIYEHIEQVKENGQQYMKK